MAKSKAPQVYVRDIDQPEDCEWANLQSEEGCSEVEEKIVRVGKSDFHLCTTHANMTVEILKSFGFKEVQE